MSMANLGAAIEAAISRITKRQIRPALKEMRSALRRLEKRIDARPVGRPPSGGRGGPIGPRATNGPAMSPTEIRALRHRLGMTQAEFASSVGVTHVAVYFWESGRTSPGGLRLSRLRELERSAGKRGPGRPPGSGAKRGPGRPPGSGKKRGPGRPPGSGTKRGPGRPRKKAAAARA
jgi:DNA-binding XRE family transcriptional regulator